MRTWIWMLLVLIVAIALGLVLREHSGNVLIVAQPWRIELSLTFAVLLLVVVFFLVYVAVRLLSWVASGPGRFRAWRGWRSEKRDHELLEAGWLNVLQGRFTQGQKDLSKVMGRTRASSRKVLAGLASAQATHHLADYPRRDQALDFARRSAGTDPQLKDAVASATAEMYLDQNRAQDALVLLQPLQDANSRYFNATRLLLRAHRQLHNHDRVYELTRLLLRRGVLDKTQAMPLIEAAVSARLLAGGIDGFKAVWHDLKSDEKVLPDVALAAASVQSTAGNHDEAAKILENALNVSPDPRLLGAYSQCPADQVARRLGKAEVWLKAHPQNFALLAALGQLCLIGQLWGQGERYLLRSMRIRSDVRIHALLGNLYDRLGRHADAMKHWRLAAGVAGTLSSGNPLSSTSDFDGDLTLVNIERIPAAPYAPPPTDDTSSHYFDSAPVPGLGTSDEAARGSAQSADKSVLDEYFDSAPVVGVTVSGAAGQASALSSANDGIDDYFDSAPIPGVDLSQTSDKPQGGSTRR